MQAYGMWRYSLWKQRRDRERIEERSAQLALEPLLLAERDRWVQQGGAIWGENCYSQVLFAMRMISKSPILADFKR